MTLSEARRSRDEGLFCCASTPAVFLRMVFLLCFDTSSLLANRFLAVLRHLQSSSELEIMSDQASGLAMQFARGKKVRLVSNLIVVYNVYRKFVFPPPRDCASTPVVPN